MLITFARSLTKLSIRASLIAGIVLLSACSALTEFRSDMADKIFGAEPPNPPAELEEIKASYTAKVDWSAQLGETDKYDYTPALEAGYVYGTNTEGEVVKLDVISGKEVWRLSIGEAISGGVGVGGGLVLVGSNRGNLHAIDVTGKPMWVAKLSSEILSVPRYFDGRVIKRNR